MILHNALRTTRHHCPSHLITTIPSPSSFTTTSLFKRVQYMRVTVKSSGDTTDMATDQMRVSVKSSADTTDQKLSSPLTRDVMAESFGEGYSTRSDEEGFGGIYGGNQNLPKHGEEDLDTPATHPEFDMTQGSEVKEKEKGRNQANGSC